MAGSPEIGIDAFAARRSDGALVIDVREPGEYVAGHVPGARLVPLDTLPRRVRDLPHGRPVYVICAGGNRSSQATRQLRAAGIDAVSVAGGTTAWAGSGRPLVTGAAA